MKIEVINNSIYAPLKNHMDANKEGEAFISKDGESLVISLGDGKGLLFYPDLPSSRFVIINCITKLYAPCRIQTISVTI